jgi:heptosyltransferase-2
VRLDELGDVVLSSPFLRELRRNASAAWITLVVKPEAYELVEFCPYVNELLTYDCRAGGRVPQLWRHGRALKLAATHLWRHRYDLAVLPRRETDLYYGTFITYFSGAPWRVGYSEDVDLNKQRRNSGFDRLLTHAIRGSGVNHAVECNLDVLRFLCCQVQDTRTELWLDEQDERFAKEYLARSGASGSGPLIAFGIGASNPRRIWPVERFAEVGSWAVDRHGARVLLLGGGGEEPLGEILQRELGSGVVNAVGRTTIRQAGSLLKHCALFVGNDSGPMHLAAAVGVPVVEISCHPQSGSLSSANSPVSFGPWGVPNRILQPSRPIAPCTDRCSAREAHCIRGVGVADVQQAITGLLVQTQSHSRGDVSRPLPHFAPDNANA